MLWQLLILSLPTENASARMRSWRALKGCGAAQLRDGVYVLPQVAEPSAALALIAEDLRANGGTAHLLGTEAAEADFAPLFDRSADFGALLTEISACQRALDAGSAQESIKQARKLRKTFDQLAGIDFFAGEAQAQAAAALEELDLAAHQLLSPGEPRADRRALAIKRLQVQDFQGRLWATRRRPWVDRLACAWLIRRCIDAQATILWLNEPADCPANALGFDFDGAAFSHVGSRVSFEVMLASFGLETAPLLRLGLLVHGLDAGGVQAPEGPGVERVLAGLRDTISDEDQLLSLASSLFDGLLASFKNEIKVNA